MEMTPENFVKRIIEDIINADWNSYRDLFNKTDMKDVTDEYWKRAIVFYSKLDVKDKDVFFSILKQIIIDTISSMLGLLDGVFRLKNQDEAFELKYSGVKLNEYLQDIFLSNVEEQK